MADSAAMRRSAAIVAGDPEKRLIVVSATSGTTNSLTALIDSSDHDERQKILGELIERHLAILGDLKDPGFVKESVEEVLAQLKEVVAGKDEDSFTRAEMDECFSFGERLSSLLFTGVLREAGVQNVQWFDVRDVMITDSQFGHAEPQTADIRRQAEEKLTPRIKTERFVTQGFIGRDRSGATTTLGRGGSDYSAALLAEALDADVLEIWTDVTAVYTTDPRMVPDARPITEISFSEAAELSVFGAKVLHPATLKPAIRKKIRVYVGSSMEPDQPGTWIVKETRETPPIRAISVRRDQTLLTIHSLEMLHRHGFLARLFQILADHQLSVDLVTTSEVSVSLTLDTNVQGVHYRQFSDELLRDLRKIAEVGMEKGLSLVALVGNNLDKTAGVSGPLFNMLQDINIRLICHGASSHNLCFLVREEEVESVVRKLHDRFITKAPGRSVRETG